ncbi:hypothetical protein H6P81_017197 [Aristolochia fimbriata]|uniref:Mesoderm development candidate 2 n=1 Tax=Aristolochia fimbriata TaxID=158543 RepID=A0AAV7DYH4_ARIFI|nr:hypothetical protein H6P81_017197 [Aristolochia fimbriata]
MMMKKHKAFCSLLLFLLVFTAAVQFFAEFQSAEAKRRVSIPDDLDDVEDDEEDEGWKEWGKKTAGPKEFDPPPDIEGMDLSKIQDEMLKRQFGPVFGFVKLRLGVPRNEEDIPEIATRWAKVLRTASMEAQFAGIDLYTIMFSMENGQDIEEFKNFILSQPEAYEIKIGDHIFRRSGDPPLEEVIEMLKKQRGEENNEVDTVEEPKHQNDEL